jgi:hypothetical protein
MLAIDEFPCEDAYTNERALFDEVLSTVEALDVWVADRNFCTCKFLVGIAQKQAYFIIRQHASMPYEALSELTEVGDSSTGKVFEQSVRIQFEGESISARRVVIYLTEPTGDSETEVAVFTNLIKEEVGGILVSQIYLKRWTVEGLFQVITDTLECEIKTLGYPKAALFSFCMALVAYNILAVIKAALRSVHGQGKIDAGISNYYFIEEIQSTYTGMMIALPDVEWQFVNSLTFSTFVELLQKLASQVDLKRFAKSPRGPKKPQSAKKKEPSRPHVSTARLLAEQSRHLKLSRSNKQSAEVVKTPTPQALRS